MTDSLKRDRSLKIALETRPLPQAHQVGQMVKMVNGMPVPALLLTQAGKILTVNAKARTLISRMEGHVPEGREKDLWEALGWPHVPFCHWPWKGTLVSAWDWVLEGASPLPNLKIRYLCTEAGANGEPAAHPHRLARLGQEVMRVVHDIRNPLTSMEWCAALLGKAGQPLQDRTDLVNHFVHALRMLDASLANILIFAQPIRVDRRRFRISRLLREVEWMALHPLRQKAMTVHQSVEPGLEEVWGDEMLLSRAVLNVVLNAIQVSPSGGHIEIVCQRVSPQSSGPTLEGEKPNVRILIRDFGCGIPGEEVTKMFDPFFSKRKGGTGLGLSIVKDIMSAHHGLIDVQSEHGKGTTICLVLPQ